MRTPAGGPRRRPLALGPGGLAAALASLSLAAAAAGHESVALRGTASDTWLQGQAEERRLLENYVVNGVCGEIVDGSCDTGAVWGVNESLTEQGWSNPSRRRQGRDYLLVNVPGDMLGSPFLYSGVLPWPGESASGSWSWTIRYTAPCWVYVFQEVASGSGLADALAQDSEWSEVDAGDFAIRRATSDYAMRLWTKYFESGSSTSITLTGSLVGGASSRYCTSTTTTTSKTQTATTTTTSTTTGTTTKTSTTRTSTSTWTGSSTTQTTTTRTATSTTSTTSSTRTTTSTVTTTSTTSTSPPITTKVGDTSTTTTSSTMTTTTVDPWSPTMQVAATIGGVDYDQLMANATLQSSVEQAMQKQIVGSFPEGQIDEGWVSIEMSPGSVKVISTISIPAESKVSFGDAVSMLEEAASSLATKLGAAVSSVPGIDAVATSGIYVSGLTAGLVTSTTTTTMTSTGPEAAPGALSNQPKAGAKASALAAVVVGGALLGFVVLVVLLCPVLLKIKWMCQKFMRRLSPEVQHQEFLRKNARQVEKDHKRMVAKKTFIINEEAEEPSKDPEKKEKMEKKAKKEKKVRTSPSPPMVPAESNRASEIRAAMAALEGPSLPPRPPPQESLPPVKEVPTLEAAASADEVDIRLDSPTPGAGILDLLEEEEEEAPVVLDAGGPARLAPGALDPQCTEQLEPDPED